MNKYSISAQKYTLNYIIKRFLGNIFIFASNFNTRCDNTTDVSEKSGFYKRSAAIKMRLNYGIGTNAFFLSSEIVFV